MNYFRGAIISGSLNLDQGSGAQTGFFAYRIAERGVPYSQIEASWEQSTVAYEDMPACTLEVGDMILIGRGVIHGSLASEDRKSITYRTRGFVSSDFK